MSINKKLISIVIPIRNEENYIKDCIESIINFDYPDNLMEVLLIDGSSTDNTIKIIKEYQKKYSYIKLLHNSKKIVPISMNIGIKEAVGNYIVRLDAHAKYPSNYISKLLNWSEKLDADNVGTVCQTEIKSNTLTAKSIKFVMSDKFGVGNSLFRTGVNSVKEVDTVPFGFFKKEVFDKIGLYDERLVRVQDLELNKRLKNSGGKIYLVPDIKCTYFPRETFFDFFKNRFLTGLWIIKTPYLTKNTAAVSLRHFIPLLFILVLIVSFILGVFIGFYYFLLLLSTYGIILFTRALFFEKKPLLAFKILQAYFILHVSYGLGSLKGYIENIILRNES